MFAPNYVALAFFADHLCYKNNPSGFQKLLCRYSHSLSTPAGLDKVPSDPTVPTNFGSSSNLSFSFTPILVNHKITFT